MIREDLLEFQYYLDRLSEFMKESYGMEEHVEIFYQQLIQVNNKFDYLFSQLDIFNKGYNENGTISSLIDKIGEIFGCYRNFTIYLDNNYVELNLNDNDFLIYIKCQILKQNFRGTREELSKIYSTIDQGEYIKGLLDLKMIYVLNQTQTPTISSPICNIYWTNYSEYSEDLIKLFKAGYLTIESMGILYNRIAENIDDLGIFADINQSYTQYFYYFAGKDGDYYIYNNVYYIWDEATNTWSQSSTMPSTGTNWGTLSNLDDLPTSLKGGIFA